MRISLAKKLSLVIITAILGSITLTSLISNYMVEKKFGKYLIDEHNTKVDNAVRIVEGLYSETAGFSNFHKDELQRYAELQDLFIEVKDSKNNVIYSSGASHLKKKNAMGNSMRSMMKNFSGINLGEYTENTYQILVDSKSVGTVTIGYLGTSYLSSGSVFFMSTLNHSFLLSAFIALIFALFISVIISRQISKPIVNITRTANKIRCGNLESRSSINTSTSEIIDLSNSINYLARTLSEQEMLRKRLTSDIAHELRTPLTTLKTHIEAFIDGIWEPTTERFESFYEEIERLTKLVDNLRNLAKYEQETLKLNLTAVNLSVELEKIVDSFRPLYTKNNYQLESTIMPDINALIDKDKFKQIINNLLSNSFMYLKEKGKVRVILSREQETIVIKVIDNGIGIPEQNLPFIFERFYRSDLSRSSDTGGSGIGLTITKAFVEAHAGEITVKSKEGKGTAFTITFPVNNTLSS
ncbi:MAG: HAMP domain-containing sensor histidine kinase [Clostridiaceae bacterium]